MSDKMPRLPNNSQHIAIVGRNGTGKTVTAIWHLSKRNYMSLPWVIVDFKNDEHIAEIEESGAVPVDLSFEPKKRDKGIFIVRPLPGEEDSVKDFMWRIWAKENCGVYVDEGYMIAPDNNAFDALLTQGRSKHIPMIVLSQRPVWMSRFVFSESQFYQVFSLNDIRDEKTVSSFIRNLPTNYSTTLPIFNSYYYDVGRNSLYRFAPVPTASEIYASFSENLSKRKRFL